MDDIGNLVYVLLILLFVVMQIFAASKKKKQKQQGSEGGETNPWDEVFGEMTGEQTAGTSTEQPTHEEPAPREADAPFDPEKDYRQHRQPAGYEREKAKPAAEKPQPAQPVNKYMKYMRNKARPDSKKRTVESSVTPEVEFLEDGDDQFNFDLRKAILYSAILKRKW